MENSPELKIRREYDANDGMWYYSLLDVIEAITGTQYPRRYWNVLKRKLATSGCTAQNNVRLRRMLSPDGKYHETSAADAETILRIVQSISGKEGEPIKLWLARVGLERLYELRHNTSLAMPLDELPMAIFAEAKPPT